MSLQQFLSHHMFELEHFIESSGNTISILSCPDEECIMPKATGATFAQKLQLWAGKVLFREKSHPGKEKYTPVRFEQGFIMKHYAGDVEYRTNGWLEKNKDALYNNLTRVIGAICGSPPC